MAETDQKAKPQQRSWRPRTGKKIDALYAWVAEEPDGGEGICSAQLGDGLVYPRVGADIERMRSIRHYAEITRRGTGYPVRLVRYGCREDLEELS